jgi:hypothetical protein
MHSVNPLGELFIWGEQAQVGRYPSWPGLGEIPPLLLFPTQTGSPPYKQPLSSNAPLLYQFILSNARSMILLVEGRVLSLITQWVNYLSGKSRFKSTL